jgi:hypothetical protein
MLRLSFRPPPPPASGRRATTPHQPPPTTPPTTPPLTTICSAAGTQGRRGRAALNWCCSSPNPTAATIPQEQEDLKPSFLTPVAAPFLHLQDASSLFPTICYFSPRRHLLLLKVTVLSLISPCFCNIRELR